MATRQASCMHAADEGYIEMEVSSSSNTSFFCYSPSQTQSREFEFQMCTSSASLDGDQTSTSPADELFYKGNLLPLHLPPRLQMVQKLVQSSDSTTTPTASDIASSSTNASARLESESESCRVSSELNPDDDCFFEWSSAELNGFINGNYSKNYSWSSKLKQSSIIGRKLKASRAYLKSLFSKSVCADEFCAKAAACNVDAGAETVISKGKSCVNKYMKMAKKNPFGKIDNDRYKMLNSSMKSMIDRESSVEDAANSSHRRSFSGVIQRHSSTTKSSSTSTSSSGFSSSSSSFSFSSSGFCDLQLLKRSNSANSEIENSVEGAIAHCKQSQQMSSTTRKTASEVGVCSLSAASKISASGDQETRPGLCSILI